jgi:rubredoxin
MSYDAWKTRTDRDADDPAGVSDRDDTRPARRWRCAVCGTRYDLAGATRHAQQTGHGFLWKGQPVPFVTATPVAEVG